MGEQGYNGWSNYETWAMALWIDNEQGSYSYVRELAEQAKTDNEWPADEPQSWGEVGDQEHATVRQLAESMKQWQEDAMESFAPSERPASVFTDLLNAAFSEVDWWEIARTILSEV